MNWPTVILCVIVFFPATFLGGWLGLTIIRWWDRRGCRSDV